VLVVLASASDSAAANMVARWGASRARLLTCRDLSRDGWRYRPGAASRSTAVVDGARMNASEIDGVVVRLPYVPAQELAHIALDDRAYVAHEMTAFLTAWLAELPCPVVNRPSPLCLTGPGWAHAQWLHAAEELGIRVARRPCGALTRVTVVGDMCVDAAAACLAEPALRVAAAAGVHLLDVHFDQRGERLVKIDIWPDLARAEVADALLAFFG
jgi:hypothetical protein